jgi:hypothetical protein
MVLRCVDEHDRHTAVRNCDDVIRPPATPPPPRSDGRFRLQATIHKLHYTTLHSQSHEPPRCSSYVLRLRLFDKGTCFKDSFEQHQLCLISSILTFNLHRHPTAVRRTHNPNQGHYLINRPHAKARVYTVNPVLCAPIW